MQKKATTIAAIVISALLLTTGWGILSAQAARIRDSQQSEQVPMYIMAGGQSGSWFSPDQYPALYKVGLGSNRGVLSALDTVPNTGSVWSGGWNGSDWLVTGWGWGDSEGLNPYVNIFDSSANSQQFFSNYTEASSAEQEWAGGDVFSATWNGSVWLLTGMGSGALDDYGSTNHFSMGFLTENGTFIDLSGQIPEQQDGILYASAWNGEYWLVGGGWYGFGTGVLFMVSPGGVIIDLTSLIKSSVPSFDAVQTIAWNGEYWLIGGVGFLAKYDPVTSSVYDLTPQLNVVLGANDSLNSSTSDDAVNSIAWTGSYWMLAGGVPIGYGGSENSTAWVASYKPDASYFVTPKFVNLTPKVIPSHNVSSNEISSILSMDCLESGCALGGFSNNHPLLIWFSGSTSIDLSGSISSGNMTYVQWVGVSHTTTAASSTSSASSHQAQPRPRAL